MELILRTDDKSSIAKIIALADELDVFVEQRGKTIDDTSDKESLKKWLLNFKASGASSFGDAAEWERNEREDRDLPFSQK